LGRPGRSVRVGILAGIVAWHALVVLLLLRQQVVLPRHPEFVTTWLRFEPEPPRQTKPEAPAPPALLSPSLALPPLPSPPAPDPAVTTAITEGPEIDWYGQAARAARDQYARRLPTPRVLEEKPKDKESPAPAAKAHRKGEQEDAGNGEWRVWLSARCWMLVSNAGPPPPGQMRPALIGCLRKGSPIDAAVLERRKPDYLLEPPLTIPRKGNGSGQTRPGPAMGGTPRP
jgi:hypothetical protein